MSFTKTCGALLRMLLLNCLILGAAAAIVGCATNTDSDIPWNVPQQWEGVPALPSGFPQQ